MIAGSSVLAIYSPKPLSSYCFNLSILFSDDYGVGIYTRLRTIKMTYAASYQALIILFGLGLSERMKRTAEAMDCVPTAHLYFCLS
jgi:hypothetical protein